MAEEKKQGNPVPISVNTFYKGMNKDISKYAMKADQYYDANNIRIVANSGKEGAALVNIEGNDHLVDIPISPAVWEIKQDPNVNLLGVAWSLTTTFSAGTWGVFSITITGTGGSPIRDLVRTLTDVTAGQWSIDGVPITDTLGNPTTPSTIADGIPGFYYIFDDSSDRLVLWGKPLEANFQQFPESLNSLLGNTVQQVSNPGLGMLLAGVPANFFTQSNLAIAHIIIYFLPTLFLIRHILLIFFS